MNSISQLLLRASTNSIFNGDNIVNTWISENNVWNLLTKDSTYQYPTLSNPIGGMHAVSKLKKTNITKNMFWSSDGTSIVTVNSDFGVRQYLIPEQCTGSESAQQIVSFTRFFRASSIVASDVHPDYSLLNGTGDNIIILSTKHLPLQAYSLSDEIEKKYSKPRFSYDITNDKNEQYENVYSIKFLSNNEFFTGSTKNKVCLYDVSNKKPVWTSRSTNRKIGKSICKSIVSCFAESSSRGQSRTSSYFGTYKNEIGHIDKRSAEMMIVNRSSKGNGIYQLISSENEHYMFSLKRNCNNIDICDRRMNMTVVNALELPYKTDGHKMKASSSSHGLLVGDLSGNIIQWQKDVIEFGGLPSKGLPEEQNIDFKLISTPYTDSRINIVASNPTDDDQFAISFSPDKFVDTDKTNNQLQNSSGMSLFTCL